MSFGHGQFGQHSALFGAPGTVPDAPTLTNPVTGGNYGTSVGMTATATDPNLDQWFGEFSFSTDSGTTWSVIGNGSQVASGGISTLTWNLTSLSALLTYRARVRSVDQYLRSGGSYSSTANFTVQPGYTGIQASNNTDFYTATNLTAFVFSEKI